jgi:hypothetical protein
VVVCKSRSHLAPGAKVERSPAALEARGLLRRSHAGHGLQSQPSKAIQPYLHRSPGGTLRPVPLSGPRIPSKTVQNARNPAGGADMACIIDELSYHREIFTDHDSFVFESDAAMRSRISSRLSGSRLFIEAAAGSLGAGAARRSRTASSIHSSIALVALAIASAGVAPSDMQPGRSGTHATKPPPSSGGSGST